MAKKASENFKLYQNPIGELPITLPKGDDVPGYDKNQYMPAELKDENGKAYAYRDTSGNYYELGFGLRY